MLRKLLVTILFLLLPYGAAACSGAVTPSANSNPYEVDPVFREFYSYLGGNKTLGKVISPVYEKDGVKYQYTVAGQMIYDPKAEIIRQFQLGPLGKKFIANPPDEANYAVEGPFRELYSNMGGKSFVGKPLTPATFNDGKNRTEQYFENLGFYVGPETNGVARLLPYGAWGCDADCRTEEFNNAIPEMPSPTLSDNSFSQPESTVGVLETKSVQSTPQPQTPATAAAEPQEDVTATKSPEPHKWTLQVIQELPDGTDPSQKVAVVVNQDGKPYPGAMPFLEVELPDKSELRYDFPPTNEQGMAIVTIDPISVKVRKTVKYQVCLNGEIEDVFCVLQSYTVYPNP